MNALRLTATENFMDAIPCDFWNTADDEYLVTREQIGRALGYSNPAKAIEKIHLKHKDRLDRFSCRIKSELSRSPQFGGGGNEGNGAIQERTFYNRKGIMEICRWSRQPVAVSQLPMNLWTGVMILLKILSLIKQLQAMLLL